MKCLYKRFSLVIFTVAFLGSACSSLQGIYNIRETDEEFKKDSFAVMTYNIRVGCGGEDWEVGASRCLPSKKDLVRIAEAIGSINPHVIGLQEVKGERQARFVAKRLNMNFAYRDHPSGWWGLAILSKFKILESRGHVIYNGRDSRIGLECLIDIGGTPMTFLNVHYHLGEYRAQVASTMRIINRLGGPIFLVGDLNRPPWYPELKPIRDRLTDTCLVLNNEKSRLIDQAGTGHGRIDYVFADLKWCKVVDIGLVLGDHIWASDHLAYYARVAFR